MTIEDRFKAWDAANPDFYHLFCKFANDLLATGRTQIGARVIVERIRWESMFMPAAKSGGFKINDHYTPHFARKFMDDHPLVGPVFSSRTLRTP
jgi:hypothetical protein